MVYWREMHTRKFGKYPRHRRLPMRQQLQFWGLSLLSLAAIFTIAMLSRAELRLSGQIFAANGDDLAVMERLQSFESVELIRETLLKRLYIVKRGAYQYLVHVTRESPENLWEVQKVERLH